MIRALGMAALNIALPVAALAWSLTMTRRSALFAFALNWALMGFAFVFWLIVPVRFGRSYYRVHVIERDGRLYERLGVRLFQRILRRTGFHGPKPFPGYAPGPDAFARLTDATHGPETAHALIFIVVAAVAVDAAARGWWDTAAWLLFFDIALNAYPVLSMRHVRARAGRIMRGTGHCGIQNLHDDIEPSPARVRMVDRRGPGMHRLQPGERRSTRDYHLAEERPEPAGVGPTLQRS
jgi:hypothetical protein